MICLIDTAAIIHEVKIECEEIYLTSKVIEEAKSLKAKLRLEYFLSKGKIYQPSKETLKKVKEMSKHFIKRDLSETDIEIIATAIELKEIYKKDLLVYTDDYSIQNILSNIGINFKPVATKGINKKIKWVGYCKVCKRFSEISLKRCEICGGDLTKVPLEKRKII